MSMIQVKDLAIGYDGQVVSDNINFEVHAGDYLCVVGENGAGKTTLVKTLLHLRSSMAGEIIYGDGVSAYEIGYLPQQTIVQKDFPASVWEIVLSGNLSKLGWFPFYRAKEKENARLNMEKMGILDLKDESYRNLSGGQQQRVLLARALCASSKILFLDEPVTGLDPKVTADFYNLLKNINQEGMTIVMVSHDLKSAMTYASHILHVGKQGNFYGTVDAYEESDYYKALKEDE